MSYKISPSIGVARLGNSEHALMLAPDVIGGLPSDYNPLTGIKGNTVENFKDASHCIKRQGQVFRVFENETELLPGKNGVDTIEWTVHLANKKAAWYQYTELRGNMLYPDNAYTESSQFEDVELRNLSYSPRKDLIIDAGPRTISGINECIELGDNEDGLQENYHTSFPNSTVKNGLPVTSLGTLRTDSEGRLIVFGAYGHAGGDEPLTNYGGSDTWHDDIADGSVSCKITFTDGRNPEIIENAWVIIGSPDFAPEIVNISTLSDTMFDVAVRTQNLVPDMCLNGVFQNTYKANYQRDILPIIERFRAYQWVANVQSMMAFAYPTIDFSDPTVNETERQAFFSYFREPNDKAIAQPDQQQGILFKDDIPMMPLNSGSNSVSNTTVVKFLALNETQYFLMQQWANSSFTNNTPSTYVDEKDTIHVGNCVGLPMSPGIEVTWSMQDPSIYDAPYQIKRAPVTNTGLNPNHMECTGEYGTGPGCEPGDLTKRMACPWQADFFQCTIQLVNFSEPKVNKADQHVETTVNTEIKWRVNDVPSIDPATPLASYSDTRKTTSTNREPLPPSYYSYWWPPQSPWDVLTGDATLEGNEKTHLSSGRQVNYARGINSFVQMVEHWYALAFIKNNNTNAATKSTYPYFTEVERNNYLFSYKEIGVGQVTGNAADNETTLPVFYIEENLDKVGSKGLEAKRFVEYIERRAFKAISVAPSGLGHPRSGTRARR